MGFPGEIWFWFWLRVEPCWACTLPTTRTSDSARSKRTDFIIGNAAPPIDVWYRAWLASLYMAEAVKPHVITTRAFHHQMAKKPRKVRHN